MKRLRHPNRYKTRKFKRGNRMCGCDSWEVPDGVKCNCGRQPPQKRDKHTRNHRRDFFDEDLE